VNSIITAMLIHAAAGKTRVMHTAKLAQWIIQKLGLTILGNSTPCWRLKLMFLSFKLTKYSRWN
jgi:hypothetical protein